MNENLHIFLKLLADDLQRFSVAFSEIIIGVTFVLLLVMVIFRRRGSDDYCELLKKEENENLKKVRKNLRDSSFVESVHLDLAKIIGTNFYIDDNIDFLFTSVVGKNDEINYVGKEDDLEKKITLGNSMLTKKLKENIVDIYLLLHKREKINISLFHLMFFAKYFPLQTDINLSGDFIIDVENFSLDDLIFQLENKTKEFSFKEFFYFTIHKFDTNELEMHRYMKIKTIFKDKIAAEKIEITAIKKQKKKNEETKIEQEIFRRFLQKDPNQKTGKNGPVFVEKKSDVFSKDESEKKCEVEVENKPKNKIKKQFEKSSEKQSENKDSGLIFNDDGSVTTQVNEDKKNIVEDIKDQKNMVDKISNEFEEEALEQSGDDGAKIDEKELKKLGNEIFGNSDVDNTDMNDNENKNNAESDGQPIEKNTKDFSVATVIEKKEFKTVVHFKKVLSEIAQLKILKTVDLFFVDGDKTYLSGALLFMFIEKRYKLSAFDKFDKNFCFNIASELKIIHKKTIEIKFIRKKIPGEERCIKVLCLELESSFVESIIKSSNFSNLPIEKSNGEEFSCKEIIDIIDYLKGQKV